MNIDPRVQADRCLDFFLPGLFFGWSSPPNLATRPASMQNRCRFFDILSCSSPVDRRTLIPTVCTDSMASRTDNQNSLARRLRLVLWHDHQPFIAVIIVCCLIGMSFYFWRRSVVSDGLIDIDRSSRIEAEFRVDINSADWPEIVVLPGVGEKLARAIVEYRMECGPFESLSAIKDVPGIGEKKLEQLKPFLLPIAAR